MDLFVFIADSRIDSARNARLKGVSRCSEEMKQRLRRGDTGRR
jgi:hypothetical protein